MNAHKDDSHSTRIVAKTLFAIQGFKLCYPHIYINAPEVFLEEVWEPPSPLFVTKTPAHAVDISSGRRNAFFRPCRKHFAKNTTKA